MNANAALPEEAQSLHRLAMVSEFRMSHLETRLLSAAVSPIAQSNSVLIFQHRNHKSSFRILNIGELSRT